MTHKSHIEKLIQEMCPNGVNYMPLGEVCRSSMGEFVHKDKQNPNALYPVYNGGITNTGYYDQYNTIGPKVIISARGAAGFVNKVEGNFWAGNSCHVITIKDETILNWEYLYYALKTQEKEIIGHQQKGGGVPAVSKVMISELSIPLPPIAIQEEIVRILDAFANLIENIDNEIKERERQLELYLVAILEHIKKDSKSWYKLGDICYQPKERISAEELSPDNYIGVENMLQNKQGVTSSTCVPSTNAIKYIYGDILLGNIRPNLRKIWMADRIGGTNGDVVTLRRYDKFKEFLFPRYLYYILSDESFFAYNIQYSRGAKMPRGNKEKILAYPIPLPSLAEQRAIAEKLDTIEAFIANLKEERALRQQQYEYYREYLINLLK